MRRSRICACCGRPNKRHKRQAYCAACHARYMRGWRKKVRAQQQAIAAFLKRQGFNVSRVTETRSAA